MGSLFLFHDEGGFISIEYSMLLSTLAGVVVAVATIVWFLFKERKSSQKPSHFFLPVGTKGAVMTAQGHSYQIKVKGEIWNATSSENLLQGDLVKVVSIDTEKLLLHIQKDKESL
jgi:membrane protein implicated in regulation of membrane protease activity